MKYKQNNSISSQSAWLLLSLFSVPEGINCQYNEGKRMATTNRKKAGRTNKAATTNTTKKSTKPTKPDIALIECSPEERWKVIAVAAYHKAEKRGFAPGDELQDWVDAEKEIDSLLYG
jgi:hypothetical protein